MTWQMLWVWFLKSKNVTTTISQRPDLMLLPNGSGLQKNLAIFVISQLHQVQAQGLILKSGLMWWVWAVRSGSRHLLPFPSFLLASTELCKWPTPTVVSVVKHVLLLAVSTPHVNYSGAWDSIPTSWASELLFHLSFIISQMSIQPTLTQNHIQKEIPGYITPA